MSHVDADERYAIYKNPDVAYFLTVLVEKGEEVVPKYDLAYGYRYQEVEETIGQGPVETREFLRNLARLGILKENLFDMAIHCPACGGADISTNYVCPFCGSPRIVRNALIEHIACGYIDNLVKFKVGDELVCPRCKAPVGKDDYRSAGSWYESPDCGKRVESPSTTHRCRNCGEKFVFDQARYVEVYSYSLSDVSMEEVKSGALFTSLAKRFFTDMEYEVEVPGRIAGESGIQHEFDVLLRGRRGEIAAIDNLFSKEPIDQSQIMREYAKILDTKIQTYVIVFPSLNEEAGKLARSFSLNIIEGNPSESLNILRDALMKGIPPSALPRTPPEKKATVKAEKKPEKKPEKKTEKKIEKPDKKAEKRPGFLDSIFRRKD